MSNEAATLGLVSEEGEKKLEGEALLFLSIARTFHLQLEPENALRLFIQSVCEMTKWPVAHIYVPTKDDPRVLESTKIWHISDPHHYAEFQNLFEKAKFKMGDGLAGKVFLTGISHWIEDVHQDHSFIAKNIPDIKVGAALGVPIRQFGQIVAIVEFFLSHPESKDSRMLELIETAADQLNILMDHMGVQKRLHENYSQLEQALQSLKQTQAKLIQSEKMASLGTLAAGIAHEINNPIAFVMSNLHVLKSYSETFVSALSALRELKKACLANDASAVSASLQKIDKLDFDEDLDFALGDLPQLIQQSIEGTNRVRDIVKNLKEFAHLDEAEFKSMNINEGIRSTLKIAWNELKYKCEVVEELNDIPAIYGLPQELNQVFLNLIVNAAQAIPESGILKIKTFEKNKEVVVVVSDTGCGIPPENLKKIFDPFFTTKPIGKGTGLGLSVVHDIVEKHRGRIEVDSVVNQGTTFSIYLPVEQQREGSKP